MPDYTVPSTAGVVASVSRSGEHNFSKVTTDTVQLIAGLGVEGDAHAGKTVKHRSRVAKEPAQPNLRQVHLLHAELLDGLNANGFSVRPGDLGENILTRRIDLLGLPTGARLHIGPDAVVEITGLRNPCWQIDAFQKGLLAAVLDRDADGAIVRKTGVMAVVVQGGQVGIDDRVVVSLPPEPHEALAPV